MNEFQFWFNGAVFIVLSLVILRGAITRLDLLDTMKTLKYTQDFVCKYSDSLQDLRSRLDVLEYERQDRKR